MYTLYDTTTAATAAQAILVKESVDDIISNLFPVDTPLQQYLTRRPMDRVSVELPVDTFSGITRTSSAVSMAAAAGRTDTTVQAEGSTPTAVTDTYEKKLVSVTEIHTKAFEVSGTARAGSFYGITDPYAYSAFKRTEELVNDLELRLWHGRGTMPGGGVINDFAAGTAAGNGIGNNAALFPRQTQGLFNTIVRSGLERTVAGTSATTFYDAHGTRLLSDSPAYDYRSYAIDLNGQNMTRDSFRSLMRNWWGIGGRPDGSVGFCGGKMKQLFSDFAQVVTGQVNTREVPAANKTIYDTVDVYVTDYGMHWINLCRYLELAQSSIFNTTSAGADVTVAWDESIAFIMPQYWQIGVYRGVGLAPLAKTGDFDKGMIVGEIGLICRNPIAGCALVNGVA